MPLLPEHYTHGGSVPLQGTGARLSGPTCVYLGLQPRDWALPLHPRGGGALRLVPTGGVLLLPRGTAHTWPPDPEVEEILKTAHRGEPFTASPWPFCLPSITDSWNPHPLIYLTPVKKNGRSWFLYFYFICCCCCFFLTSAAMATITGVRTCVNVCDWLTVIWCSYGNQPWNGDCREWQLFLFQSVLVESETTWYESWFHDFFFSLPPFLFFTSWTFLLSFWMLFTHACRRFKTTNLHPEGLMIPKIPMHPFSAHASSF